jgi:hypothetical protein
MSGMEGEIATRLLWTDLFDSNSTQNSAGSCVVDSSKTCFPILGEDSGNGIRRAALC